MLRLAFGLMLLLCACTPSRECPPDFTCPEGREHKACDVLGGVWDGTDCGDPWFAQCVVKKPYESQFQTIHYCIPKSKALGCAENILSGLCAIIIGLFAGGRALTNKVRKAKLGIYEDK